MNDERDKLIPEIQPRAEPLSVFRSSADDIADAGEINTTADAGVKFSSRSSRDQVLQGGREVSAFETDGGSRTRSGRRQRPSSKLVEAEAPETAIRFNQAEDNGMVNNGMSHRRQRRRFAEMAADGYVHTLRRSQSAGSSDEYSDSNVGVDAAEDFAHQAVYIAGDTADRGFNRLRVKRAGQLRQREGLSQGLIFDAEKEGKAAVEAESKNWIRRYYHKQRYKRMYAESRYAEMKGKQAFDSQVRLGTKIKAALKQTYASKKRALLVLGLILLMVLLIMAAVSSCGASIHGLTSTFLATTYPSTDEDIYAVEEYYASMETQLNAQIIRMESAHPGYDEYLYQVDEISHNPYHLISYFTTKYGQFTFEQVKPELEEIFHQQYSISTSTSTHEVTETEIEEIDGEEVETEVTKTVTSFNIMMSNHDLDDVLRSRMSSDETGQYKILNTTYGNRDYLFDLDKLTTYSPRGLGITYRIPPEALSDKRFARMIREAEKYLGYPYVWGGSSPSTSFDCSGFVSWVINHCGNGWNVGRLGAEGLRQICVPVRSSDAKPGDLIFFQYTYPCGPGASHVGIYVGDGMMIHCGNPIQYTSVKAAYWQEHFLCYGRIK